MRKATELGLLLKTTQALESQGRLFKNDLFKLIDAYDENVRRLIQADRKRNKIDAKTAKENKESLAGRISALKNEVSAFSRRIYSESKLDPNAGVLVRVPLAIPIDVQEAVIEEIQAMRIERLTEKRGEREKIGGVMLQIREHYNRVKQIHQKLWPGEKTVFQV
ncbi:MAG: hypothetical protein V1817_04125 [Candidatus Micrarchaeota archaeon]